MNVRDGGPREEHVYDTAAVVLLAAQGVFDIVTRRRRSNWHSNKRIYLLLLARDGHPYSCSLGVGSLIAACACSYKTLTTQLLSYYKR